MHQMENTISIPLIVLLLGVFAINSFAQENSASSVDLLEDSVFDLDRSHDGGLGKRVYEYLSEYKRYPLFNFGLGKRSSHAYNFGLGKRSSHAYNFGLGKRFNEDGDDLEDYDEYLQNEDDDQNIPELELYPDDTMQNLNKRQKLYSFGLGKRLHRYDFGLGKRTQVHKYDFGLGKRSQAGIGRDKLYNFGLGKRNRMYSFGLGKRPYNQGPASGRFNFGLGKRSDDVDISKNIIAKREIHEEKPVQSTTEENDQPKDFSQTSTSKAEKLNSDKMESHEIMGHFDKSHLSKRSSYRYAFDIQKPVFRSNKGFSRQFRKPLYNFGLGKRMPSSENIHPKNTNSGK